jgi:ammonium transporter Rh
MTIHVFGAFFGLSCSYFASPPDVVDRSEDNAVTSISDVFSMIGTIFLYIYWPSFNAVTAAPGDPQTRAVINTFAILCLFLWLLTLIFQLFVSVCSYLALTASVFMAFIWSRLLRHDHKFNMVDVQNATLAGNQFYSFRVFLQLHNFFHLYFFLLCQVVLQWARLPTCV